MAARQNVDKMAVPPRPHLVTDHRERQHRERVRRSSTGTKRRALIALIVALVAFGSGVLNLVSVMGGPSHSARLREIFPIEFIRLSRTFTLLSGFALIVSSLNLYRRKRRAWYVVLVLAICSVVFHLTKGLDYEESIVALLLILLLVLTRRTFSVRSSVPDLQSMITRALVGAAVAVVYGIAGFWFLDLRHFGINFHIGDSIVSTVRFLTFTGDPRLVPRTHYGQWFLDSLYLTAVTAVVYAGFSLFRPVVYQFRTLPRERELASHIAAEHARTTQDFFKLWHDKSFFFSPSHRAFLAYRVARGVALVLGDPVGPQEEIEPLVRDFREFCRDNGWAVAFHQVFPEFLPAYRAARLKKLKIGDDAVIDLTCYSLDGKSKKEFRYKIRQLEGMGISFVEYHPPVPDDVVEQLREVSNEWLQIPGRRERTFTLGAFDPVYVAGTPVFAAVNSSNEVLAFVNLITIPNLAEASIDLMRRRTDAPNGVMEYIFVKLFLWAKENGFKRFNLGMAPMAGFHEREEATAEERAIHSFFQQLNFLFSFRGLRQYKAKFATAWEPRYLIYEQAVDLPRIALALRTVSEIKHEEDGESFE